jgi:hypothetical protein
VVAGLERALRWHAASRELVSATLEAMREREGLALPGVPSEAVAEVVERAAAAARRQEQLGLSKGCFVSTSIDTGASGAS